MDDQNKEFKEWLDRAAADSGVKIKESAIMTSIVTENFLQNPLCAFQIGLAVLYDKPICLIVDETMQIPKNLSKVARAIEKVRMGNEADLFRAMNTIKKIAEDLPQ
jgi:hypothetical protein